MKITNNGFEVDYTINSISTIKPGLKGVMNGKPYNAKVQFRSEMMYLTKKDDLEIEISDKLEFRIDCDDDFKMKELYRHIVELKNNGIVFKIKGTTPKKVQNQEDLRVLCFVSSEQFIKQNPLKN